MNRFSHEHPCNKCSAMNVYPTWWTLFTNIFKRPRIVKINASGPTPGLYYPGEKVKYVR